MGTRKKNKLKANALTTLFSHSKPKQQKEWSMKHKEVSAKKQVLICLIC